MTKWARVVVLMTRTCIWKVTRMTTGKGNGCPNFFLCNLPQSLQEIPGW